MRVKIFLLAVATTLLSPSIYAQEGASLFEAKCATCHQMTPPQDMSSLVAPPVMGVMRHVKMRYNTKDEAVKFITEYAMNPDASKAVCMPQKLKRFGLMPSQKDNVSQNDLRTIAAWMYDNFPSGNFQGMGRGQGQNCQSQ